MVSEKLQLEVHISVKGWVPANAFFCVAVLPMIACPVRSSATTVMTAFTAWPYSQFRRSFSQLPGTDVQFAVSCLTACEVKTASPSCAARKASPRASTTLGRRNSWKPASAGWQATRPVLPRPVKCRPVIIAQIIRRRILTSGGQAALDRLLAKLGPVSLLALLATLVLLFGFQGEQIIAQPMIIGLLAVPILIQVYLNSGLAYLLNRMAGEQHCVAGPSALIGASNFFELAVAAAISLFGFHSGAALATVVGVLIEVPVMLSVVWIVNRSKGWYERGGNVADAERRVRLTKAT